MEASPGRAALRTLAAEPERAAVLLDVDGTLAPIVARPELAAVPDKTRSVLEQFVRRYALVACISGRPGREAEQIVGVPGIVYVGVHGLELDPAAERWREHLRAFADEASWPVEDKGLALAFHFREVRNELDARARLEQVAERAATAGLVARFGRKVLEVRPPVEADKGTAVRTLLRERNLRRALYAGDDTTDLDAFRGLDGLELAVRIAVASDEAPRALLDAADVVVEGPAGVRELLREISPGRSERAVRS